MSSPTSLHIPPRSSNTPLTVCSPHTSRTASTPHPAHPPIPFTHSAALFSSLETLRTQLLERNQVIERQTIRLGGLRTQVAALEASKATYEEMLKHKDAQLGQLQVGGGKTGSG